MITHTQKERKDEKDKRIGVVRVGKAWETGNTKLSNSQRQLEKISYSYSQGRVRRALGMLAHAPLSHDLSHGSMQAFLAKRHLEKLRYKYLVSNISCSWKHAFPRHLCGETEVAKDI